MHVHQHVAPRSRHGQKFAADTLAPPVSNTCLRPCNCRKYGHIFKRCPEKKCVDVQGIYQGSPDVPYWVGEGCPTDSILLDTGCSRTMFQRRLVLEGKMLPGEAVTIHCAHGDTVVYPLASLQLQRTPLADKGCHV